MALTGRYIATRDASWYQARAGEKGRHGRGFKRAGNIVSITVGMEIAHCIGSIHHRDAIPAPHVPSRHHPPRARPAGGSCIPIPITPARSCTRLFFSIPACSPRARAPPGHARAIIPFITAFIPSPRACIPALPCIHHPGARDASRARDRPGKDPPGGKKILPSRARLHGMMICPCNPARDRHHAARVHGPTSHIPPRARGPIIARGTRQLLVDNTRARSCPLARSSNPTSNPPARARPAPRA